MFLRFIHTIEGTSILFFWLNNILLYVYRTFCEPVHLPLGICSFYPVAIVDVMVNIDNKI